MHGIGLRGILARLFGLRALDPETLALALAKLHQLGPEPAVVAYLAAQPHYKYVALVFLAHARCALPGLPPAGARAARTALLRGLRDFRRVRWAGALTTVDRFVFDVLLRGGHAGALFLGGPLDLGFLAAGLREAGAGVDG